MKNLFTHLTLRNFCLSALLLWSASLDAASVWADFFPAKMMDKNGNEVNRDAALGNKIVGIYFSASWCGPCRTFSPRLVDFRNKNSNKFEVVFASSDRSKSAQLAYMKDKKMDFPAVECKTNAANKLFSKFGTSGIPRLVIISPSDGSTISTNGRNEVTHERLNPSFDCLAKWKKSVVVKEGPDDKIFPEAMRTWKDVDGREIQAVFKGLEGDRVKLEKDGQVYIFPVSRLSAADQSYARNLQAPPPKPLPIAPDATE